MNVPEIILTVLLSAAAAAALTAWILNIKKGRSCGFCNCESCAARGRCHKKDT